MNIRVLPWAHPFSPYKYINQVPVELIFETMTVFFQHWGCPVSLRVDNGLPFGSSEISITTALALALIGYDIKVIKNRPHTPQQNGKVERQQGTSIRWAEVAKCSDLQVAQKQLDEACLIQREKYPVTRLKRQTRIQIYPQLHHKERIWQPENFKTQRVYDFLASKTYIRKASNYGQVNHFAQAYYLGVAYKNQPIVIKFDAFLLSWDFYTPKGEFIKSLKTVQFSEDKLRNFTVFSKN